MASSSSSSSSSSRSWKYDVFLSFRGEDTRKTFVDHLYYALETRTIRTYKDDVTLDQGDTIGPSLVNAIQSSQILVIIFSENYGESSWCLDELSHIMKCKDSDTGQIVFPIFYHVDPSDVRKQKRKYGEAFAKHELSEINKNKVESWKKALVDASNIAGWETKHAANGHEAKCIQDIVDSILGKVSSLNTALEDEELVGMRSRLEKLKFQLRIGSGGVRMVGIWGLGGGGKTTLATSLYKECYPNFDGCCFVENIREASKQHDGLKSLQEKILSTIFDKKMKVESVELGKDKIKQMLCRRKVLIVLDDVDHPDQLKAFAGCPKWFGDGSRIIITTRDQHLLLTHRVEVSPISLLSREEAARLLRRHAYHEDNPVQDYEELSQQIVTYAAGLPLALIVLGSFLYDKDKDEWLSTLDRLKYIPETDILEKLKISYDGLKDEEKEIFLDIACFFRNEPKGAAMRMLDACGFHPTIGVKVLIQKALISFDAYMERFDMHDLVQEMAHYIVRGEHPKNPEKHSRIWQKEDIEDICFRNATMENDKIEAIQCVADVSSSNFITLLSNMKKLRFLDVKTTSFDEGPSFLSNELRYLVWSHCAQTKLVYLRTEFSLQKGYKYLPYLKKLELPATRELVTPVIGGFPCLRKLLLDTSDSLEEIHRSLGNHSNTCDRLEEIHQSLGNHSSVIRASVKECKKLTRFSIIVTMDIQEILEISLCEAEILMIEANMDNLVPLSLRKVGIEVIPSFVGVELLFEVYHYSNLRRMKGNFQALIALKNFQSESPKDLINENLDELFLDSSSNKLTRSSMASLFRKLDLGGVLEDGDIPNEIGELSNFRELYLWEHGGGLEDGDLPNVIGELSNLRELYLRKNGFTRLNSSLSRLTSLKLLDLSWCGNFVELPELPSSLAILRLYMCKSLEVIKDDAHIRCKSLCEVSIWGEEKNITGGERLLESMLQGNAVESRCMILRLSGLEIPRGFEPRVVRGERCRMQLPENWYNHFFGFLFCVVIDDYNTKITTRMKHDKSVVDDRTEKNDDDRSVVDWLEGSKSIGTWVGYISFGSLRNTLWWDQTSTAIEFEFASSDSTIIGCGCKLIPKRSETTIITDSSSFDDVSNDYNCKLDILHDSESTFKFYIDNAVNPKYL